MKYENYESEVLRRFSDFAALRKALVCKKPFNFMFPVHKKQIFVF